MMVYVFEMFYICHSGNYYMITILTGEVCWLVIWFWMYCSRRNCYRNAKRFLIPRIFSLFQLHNVICNSWFQNNVLIFYACFSLKQVVIQLRIQQEWKNWQRFHLLANVKLSVNHSHLYCQKMKPYILDTTYVFKKWMILVRWRWNKSVWICIFS